MSSPTEDFESYAHDILDEIREVALPLKLVTKAKNEPYDDHLPNDNYRNRIDPSRLDLDRPWALDFMNSNLEPMPISGVISTNMSSISFPVA